MEGLKLTKLSELTLGSVVRQESEADNYFITAIDEESATGVRNERISNPSEWNFENGKPVGSLDSLECGNILIHASGNRKCVVLSNDGSYCSAIRSIKITDPSGWLHLPRRKQTMKLDVTPAQLEAIKEMADNTSASVGCGNEDFDKQSTHQVKMVDAMLKRNNLPPRDFN